MTDTPAARNSGWHPDLPDPNVLSFQAIVVPADEGGFCVFEPVTGIASQGQSINAARRMISDALQCTLDAVHADGSATREDDLGISWAKRLRWLRNAVTVTGQVTLPASLDPEPADPDHGVHDHAPDAFGSILANDDLDEQCREISGAQEIADFYGNGPAPLPDGVSLPTVDELRAADEAKY